MGALAVVISLIYLAVQMRQNTRAVRGTSFQAVTDAFNQFKLSIAHDKELARIFRLGSRGVENLDEDQQIQFAFLCLSAVRIFDTMYHQSKLGTGELGLWRAEERSRHAAPIPWHPRMVGDKSAERYRGVQNTH